MKVNYTSEQMEAMKRLYGQFLKPGNLVFNVGANKGDRTAVFVELGAMVIAVEPQAEMAALLRRRFLNKPVRIIEAAAGATDGTIMLRLCPQHRSATCEWGWVEALGGGRASPPEKWHESIEVKQITLDTLVARYGLPDFIKIDVEGYEREVIKGLSHRAAAVCFEATIPYLDAAIEGLVDLSDRLGYGEFNYLVREEMRLVLDEWVSGDEMAAILKDLPAKTWYCDVFAR